MSFCLSGSEDSSSPGAMTCEEQDLREVMCLCGLLFGRRGSNKLLAQWAVIGQGVLGTRSVLHMHAWIVGDLPIAKADILCV